ncbi:MAG: DUF1592 domain-containing protein [Polyangiaceae bacterium]|nr:DUF1592 domain-containing protein [Polyangiaceae bacterium]
MSCNVDGDPGRVTLRRLTGPQYDNTVRDLLGDASYPSSAFPKDDSFEADLMGFSTLLFEKYEAAAERIVTDAWAREAAGQQPPSAKLWTCTPVTDATCGAQVVKDFARRAFRKPVSDADLAPYLSLLGTVPGAEGVQAALQALLLSPQFLFRVELDQVATSLTPHTLSPHELATRLSYLVWGSTPDAQLLAKADAGQLSEPSAITSELTRMLADPKASALTEDFGREWLGLDAISKATPDPVLFPEGTSALLADMREETRQFVSEIFLGSAPLSGLLGADFTYLNDRLAAHYGLPSPGAGWTRVTLPVGPRRGMLGQASMLTATSTASRTSAVRRGKWIATRMLCSSPPPPPPNVGGLKPEAAAYTSERQRLEVHRADPQCASCHQLIDPLGLAMENFDALGRFRNAYADGTPIDPSGDVGPGKAFQTLEQMRELVAADSRFDSCVSSELSTYALGRALRAEDACLGAQLAEGVKAGAPLSKALEIVATSRAFTWRRGEAQGALP